MRVEQRRLDLVDGILKELRTALLLMMDQPEMQRGGCIEVHVARDYSSALLRLPQPEIRVQLNRD